MSRPEVVSCLVQRDSTALSENKGLIILSLEKSLNMSVLVVLIFRLKRAKIPLKLRELDSGNPQMAQHFSYFQVN